MKKERGERMAAWMNRDRSPTRPRGKHDAGSGSDDDSRQDKRRGSRNRNLGVGKKRPTPDSWLR